MLLSEVFDERSIKLDIQGKTKEAVFEELIEEIGTLHPELSKKEMLAVVHDREDKMNTSVMSGVAVPHGYYPGMNEVIGAIGISREGVEYESLDHKPVHLVFLIVLGEGVREKHLHVLSNLLSLLNSGGLSYIRGAKTPHEVYDILSRFH